MKKSLEIIFAIGILFAVVPNALALTKAFQVNTASGGTLTTGLVSYWNMQGNSNDYYGSNNGTDISVTYGSSYGKVAQGASFNGSNSNISVPSPSSLSFGTGDFSIAFWINPQGAWTGTYGIIGQKQNDNSPGFQVYHDSNDTNFIRLRLGDSSGNGADIKVPVSANIWTFVVVGRSSGNLFGYYNNIAVSTVSNTKNISGSSSYFHIGYADTWGSYYQGYLDEVMISSKALSTQEITDLYNGGAGQTMCNGTGGPLCQTPRRHQIVLNSFEAKFEHFIFA